RLVAAGTYAQARGVVCWTAHAVGSSARLPTAMRGGSLMTDPVRVFVSHHHSPDEDRFTAQLVRDLTAAGAGVWVDDQGITSDDFVQKISEGLAGQQWLVLVMTPAALRSPPVRREVNAALHLLSSGRLRGVIPLVAQHCDEAAIPPLWATLQHYDATHDY